MLDLFNAYRGDVQHIASVFLALAIWRLGGAPERWLIAIFVATMVIPVRAFEWLHMGQIAFGTYAWAYVALDIVAGIGFVAVALNANRNYPLWVAGFQLVAISAHAVKVLVDTVSPLAYLILASGPSYCQLALILGGFVRHRMRLRTFGPYRAWRAPLPVAR